MIAGAGSGKTRVLTRRIAHLLATGDARPYEIMAITFTNKAADEMRRRVVELVGAEADQMWVSTFHSACLRMLRAPRRRARLPARVHHLRRRRRRDGRRAHHEGAQPRHEAPAARAASSAAISAAKNEMLSPERYFDAYGDDPQRRRIAEIYQLYEKRLRAANAMDFDDLLVERGRDAAQPTSTCSRSYQHRFKYLLVDEFQDTNGVQNELVMMLAAEHRNLCVVGDSDQSIYRFRAADVRNILQFEQRFPDARGHLARAELPLDPDDPRRGERGHREEREPPREEPLHRRRTRARRSGSTGRATSTTRAAGSRASCAGCAAEHGIDWNEMAVFYRTNAQSRVLEEEMLRASMPYRVISGMRFYDRKEIKNALAYARLIVNPRDEASARRVINEPKRGIGEAAQAKLGAYAAEHGLSFAEAAHYGAAAGLTGEALSGRGEVLLHARRAARARQRPQPARDDRRDRARVGHGRRPARRGLRRGLLAAGEPRRAGLGGGAVRHAARLRRAHGAGRGLRPARRAARARSRS